ncbi:MAG: peptidoglycan DD-metalloendopeptidase family protein [Gammaproteobacteria bacterium]
MQSLRIIVPRRVFWVAAAVILGACGAPTRAPVSGRDWPDTATPTIEDRNPPGRESPESHVVAAGDTLYSIAWRYGQDYRDVARWNGIQPPYLIVPRQVIRLTPLATEAASPGVAPSPEARTSPRAARRHSPRPVIQAAPETAASPIQWHWPTDGSVMRSDSPTSKKGIDIGGRVGQSIHAAASGSVVYSGSGLLGYGRLIIIKHNDTFLSAYAHNRQLLVKEGDQVRTGQPIATMGLGISGRPVLHFEIRKDGKPVNPLEHLPRSSS